MLLLTMGLELAAGFMPLAADFLCTLIAIFGQPIAGGGGHVGPGTRGAHEYSPPPGRATGAQLDAR